MTLVTRVLIRLDVAVAAAACGCALLVMRPLLLHVMADPTVALLVLFAVLLATGILWPVPAHGAPCITVAPLTAAVPDNSAN